MGFNDMEKNKGAIEISDGLDQICRRNGIPERLEKINALTAALCFSSALSFLFAHLLSFPYASVPTDS